MSNQEGSSQQKGWKSTEFNMSTTPSVGRFSNDEQATLYAKGSSAKFDESDGRKSMAPYSNHGNLSTQQASQEPASDIVDLRTAPGANSMPQLDCYYLVPDGWGHLHKSRANCETSEADSFCPEVIFLTTYSASWEGIGRGTFAVKWIGTCYVEILRF